MSLFEGGVQGAVREVRCGVQGAVRESELLGHRGHLALAGAQVSWDAFVLLFGWPPYIPGELSSPVESSSFAPILQGLVMPSSGLCRVSQSLTLLPLPTLSPSRL